MERKSGQVYKYISFLRAKRFWYKVLFWLCFNCASDLSFMENSYSRIGVIWGVYSSIGWQKHIPTQKSPKYPPPTRFSVSRSPWAPVVSENGRFFIRAKSIDDILYPYHVVLTKKVKDRRMN